MLTDNSQSLLYGGSCISPRALSLFVSGFFESNYYSQLYTQLNNKDYIIYVLSVGGLVASDDTL